MLVYAIRFRTTATFTPEAFIHLVRLWNEKGKYPIADFEESVSTAIAGDDDNYIETYHLESKHILAVRHHSLTSTGVWDTDLIYNYEAHCMAIQVERGVTRDTVNINADAFVPKFLKQIISNGFVGKSNNLAVADCSIRIDDAATLDAAIHAYDDEYALPLVYINGYARIDANKLAAKLAGLAHVVYDPDNRLRDSDSSPVSLFFPHPNMEPKLFGDYPLHREIQWAVEDYLNKRDYCELETWNGVQNAGLNQSKSELLAKYRNESTDNQELTQMYNELENQLKREAELRERLVQENGKLIAENARLAKANARSQSGVTPLIMRGDESDLYSDEQREIVIEILKDYLQKSVDEGSRRYDILKAVLSANPVNGLPAKYRAIIKSALEGYTRFDTGKIQSALQETSIKIVDHTKHYKLALNGDSRYTCEAAATCSDHRGGANLSSIINKKMF